MRGEGRIFQRGRRWWIAYWGFKPNGDSGEVREPGGDTDEEARDLLRRRLREVANHRDGIRKFRGPHQERITVAELLDSLVADYRQREIKSLRQTVGEDGKGGHLKPIRAYFGPFRALAVSPDRVRRYIADRQKAGLSSAKINRETELLSRAFKLAAEEGKLSHCPKIPALAERNARNGFFERAEFEAVAGHLPDHLGDVARFAYLTGWRRGEIGDLQWENVDRAAREIRIDTSKNGEGRVLPLDDELSALIERRWTAREWQDFRGESHLSPFVFHRQGVPRVNFNRAWRRACIAAGYPDKLFHDLRRTAVRDMIRGGVSQHVAMAVSGHKTPSMFQRYNITSAEDKLDALRRRQTYLESHSSSGIRPFVKPGTPAAR